MHPDEKYCFDNFHIAKGFQATAPSQSRSGIALGAADCAATKGHLFLPNIPYCSSQSTGQWFVPMWADDPPPARNPLQPAIEPNQATGRHYSQAQVLLESRSYVPAPTQSAQPGAPGLPKSACFQEVG